MDIKRSDLKLYARRSLQGNWGSVIGATLICMGITYLFVLALDAVLFAALGSGVKTLIGIFSAAQPAAAASPTGGLSVGTLILILVILYFVYLVVLLLMSVGYQRLYLDVASGQKAKVTTLFWAFAHKPWKFVLISVLIALLEGITAAPVYIMSVAAALSGGSGFAAAFLLVYEILFIIIYAYVLLTFSQFYLILVEDPEKGIFEALSESQRLMKGNRWKYFVLQLSFIGILFLGAFSFGLATLWLSPYMGCTLALFYLALKGSVPEKLKRSPAQTAPTGSYASYPYQERPVAQQGGSYPVPPQAGSYPPPVQAPPQPGSAPVPPQAGSYPPPVQAPPQPGSYPPPVQAPPQPGSYQTPVQTPPQPPMQPGAAPVPPQADAAPVPPQADSAPVPPQADEYQEPVYKEPEYEYQEPVYKEPEYEYQEPVYKEPEYKEPEYREPEYREPSDPPGQQ